LHTIAGFGGPLIWSALGGALLGLGVHTWRYDAAAALAGARIGVFIGAVAGPVVFLVLFLAISKAANRLD
jgi:hypothetical protein